MINVHASLLPKYRGAAPIHRAVMTGDSETGVTIMRVVSALDAGPMIAKAARPIDRNEGSDALERDLAVLGADLLMSVLDEVAAGRAEGVAQTDAEATYAPRLTKEEGRLDFSRSALEVHNRIRGLRPWPMAYTFLAGARLVFHEARSSEREAAGRAPGTCVAVDGAGITIACGDGRAIEVLQVQPDGRRMMTSRDFLAGHVLLIGQRFG